jgi:hypothetical protein
VGNGLVLQRELEYGIYQEIQIFYVKVDQGLVLQKTEDSLPQKVEPSFTRCSKAGNIVTLMHFDNAGHRFF